MTGAAKRGLFYAGGGSWSVYSKTVVRVEY